jgi:cytochrome c-type biogenesis protein CcmH/NrfF
MEDWGGPAAFILLGLILIVSHVRKRRRENDAQIGMPPRSR